MAFIYNKFVILPQEHFEKMALVYYNQPPQPTVTNINVSSNNDLPKMIDVGCQADLLTIHAELIANQESIHNNSSSDTSITNENHVENTSHSIELDNSDSDCIIIDEIVPESTNESIQNSTQQSYVSESLALSASCSSTSSSYSLLPSSSSSITIECPNPDSIVLLDRLQPEDLSKFPKSKTIKNFLQSDHLTVASDDTCSFGIQNQVFSSTTENIQLGINYRQRFLSLANLIQELAEFDFPTDRPVTKDDIDRWCINKATSIINNCKKKT